MSRLAHYVVIACALTALSGCALMGVGKSGQTLSIYLLETKPALARADEPGCQVVVVTPPEPAPGYASAQMMYRRTPNQLERFAYSRWAETPASMLEPLLVDALRGRNEFAAVLASPAPVKADLRVESEGLKLVQVFEGGASRVDLELDVRVYAPAERLLLATRKLEYSERTNAATAEAGVAAADRALAQLLGAFSDIVVEAASNIATDCRNETS